MSQADRWLDETVWDTRTPQPHVFQSPPTYSPSSCHRRVLVGDEGFQVIIATSATVDKTHERLKNLPHTLLEFGEKVIRPVGS